ncbi:hypothetical protein [Streptomyces lanatus]|uniref:DUF4190 domain-containing protein n=1 Tax=Streptomyces lanatus TaxID=66900 RepID=A0ABV1XUY7_9ACTN|nr:hypothetical protein [Streptomyces lanatus]GHH11822.1 hypothetical protein GCM10018780_49890 [Streptomyces lanatus]
MRDSIATDRTDTPATALGPTALVLGALSTLGIYLFLPFTVIAGGLAMTLGTAGIHYARQGVGRMWISVLGTALGAAGMLGIVVLLASL